MRVFRNASASRTTLASLGALYLLVVSLTILLIERILLNPLDLEQGLVIALVAIGILFPSGLLVAVGLSILRLYRDRRNGRPGSGFKTRLTGFFGLVVFLAALPQGVVAVSVLSSGLETLARSGTATAIRNALELTLDYYERQVQDLRLVAADGTLAGLVEQSDGDGTLWPQLLRRIPQTAAVQVFGPRGEELQFRGDTRFRLSTPSGPGSGREEATVIRSTVAGEAVLRLSAQVAAGEGVRVVLTARLPQGLETTARGLTEAQETFGRLEQIRPRLVLIVSVLYGVFAAPMFLLSILAGFFLSDRLMRPIEALEDATRRVAEGDYTVRILSRPGDDLGVLVVSFNRMVTELERARRRMAQAEKVQAWQEIAQRLAHEVKNPLTPIKLAAERLQRRYTAGAPDFGAVLDRTVDTVVREVDVLTAMLNEFRSFSRMPEPQFAPTVLRDLVDECAAIYRDNPQVRVEISGVPPEISLPLDRGQIRQVLVNLLSNAVEAAGGRSHILVSAHRIQRGGEGWCRLRIEDDGPGIPEELRETVFEPYVTSKNRGTGLGLAIVERIVFDHEGRISFESAPGSGTTFVIDLPMEQHP